MTISEILSKLNPSQLEAVKTTEGYVRVVAGAGSGKTSALLARYAYLTKELGVSPANILCITFTNKAANEMRLRLRKMLGAGVNTSLISTLHSFCVRILKEDINKLGYSENFIILDNADQLALMKEVCEELHLHKDRETVENLIELARQFKEIIVCDDYMRDPREILQSKGLYYQKPSRFLSDIDEKFIMRINDLSKDKKANGILPVGTKIMHELYDEGVVENVDENKKVYTIHFMGGARQVKFNCPIMSQIS